jgi:glucose/mannose transport system permease protein
MEVIRSMQPINVTAKRQQNTSVKRRRFYQERLLPFLLLLPSLAAVAVFVYGFILWTTYVSFSNWNSAVMNLSFAGIKNYLYLFNDFRFQADFRNTVVFTMLFIASSLILGIMLAVFLDARLKGETFFRNLFVFPMAISFVVTGVVWQWLLNPSSGYNRVLKAVGMDEPPMWYVDTTILLPTPMGEIEFGIPVAQFSLLAAVLWQMSGFVTAMFLSGLRAIPDELREAARLDGASELQLFVKVILPMLRAVTVSVVIIVGHISLKIFDLVYAMTGPGAAFVTDMPGIYMFETTFRGHQYGQGAAIATIMLVFVSLLIVPYLISSRRKEE